MAHCSSLWEGLNLSRQTPATTRSATRQHLAPVFGRHAGTKPVIALALENAGLKCTLHGSDTFIAECADATLSATPYGPLQALLATWQAVRGADYRDRIRPMQGLDLPRRPLFRGRAKNFIHPLPGVAVAQANMMPMERKQRFFRSLLRAVRV